MSYAKSSFPGDIAEIPDIYVDNFLDVNKKAYFLSHCHTDHTQGLYSYNFLKELRKSNACIYMSEISAVIVKFEKPELGEFIRPLKLGSTTITIPGDVDNDYQDKYLNVNLIPAGHCLGSVMFLFKNSSKTILYTGDFRISQNSVSKYGQLHNNGEPIKIDTMYVDTTFQDPKYDHFPKRSETVQSVIDEIKEWLKEEDSRVAIHTYYPYGYEFIYNEIFEQLSEEVYIKEDNLRNLYSKLPEKMLGVTNNPADIKIHKCTQSIQSTHNHFNCLPDYKNKKFLCIYFSAFSWKNYNPEHSGIARGYRHIQACFATHCSRSELAYFVNYLSPKKIIGFKEPYDPKYVDKTYEDNYVATPKKKEVKTENTKPKQKVDSSLLREMFG